MSEKLAKLREALRACQLAGFILPVNDEFMGEYIPASAKRLEFLTGFTGSAGLAVVLKERAAFFTDGRYTLQAKTQVKGYELHNSGELSPEDWLARHAEKNAAMGYDPRLHTLRALQRYQKAAPNLVFKPLEPNPIDALWQDRPAAPNGPVKIHPLNFAGEDSQSKRKRMGEAVDKLGADVAILTAPDSICWLLNIRGNDVPYTPFALCYAMLCKDFGKVFLFLDPARVTPELSAHLGESVVVCHPESFARELAHFRSGNVLYDAAASPIWFHQLLTAMNANIIEASDPCQLAKAQKNPTELEGTRNAHRRDGLAVTRFLCWLDAAYAKGEQLTECSVAEKLETMRRENGMFQEPSFSTIAGSGPDGAIVHYKATEESDRALDSNSMLLLDSGAQYPDGTTDITRTIALGAPSAEMKDRFTRVLKGHIALATAVFPEGTSGSQLDALARQYLWADGLDYDHGTGHGVGSYLSVHEGPQRISKRGGDAALLPGMIVSNEPGYYKAGEYGIRIESLVTVKEVASPSLTLPLKEVEGTNATSPSPPSPPSPSRERVRGEGAGKRYFAFDTLTLAPIDMRLVEMSLLTQAEQDCSPNTIRPYIRLSPLS